MYVAHYIFHLHFLITSPFSSSSLSLELHNKRPLSSLCLDLPQLFSSIMSTSIAMTEVVELMTLLLKNPDALQDVKSLLHDSDVEVIKPKKIEKRSKTVSKSKTKTKTKTKTTSTPEHLGDNRLMLKNSKVYHTYMCRAIKNKTGLIHTDGADLRQCKWCTKLDEQ